MTEAQHEFFPAAAVFCRRCGAKRHAEMTATCVGAPVQAALAPEPARRIPACEDADAITARLAELAAERRAALSPAAVADDDCWAQAALDMGRQC